MYTGVSGWPTWCDTPSGVGRRQGIQGRSTGYKLALPFRSSTSTRALRAEAQDEHRPTATSTAQAQVRQVQA